MPYVTIDGTRLYYAESGPPDGRPLLLLHAALQTSESMEPLVRVLEPLGMRMVMPDLRGHGRSQHAGSTMTLSRLVQDITGLLDRVGMVNPVVVGYSLGGMVALDLASRAEASAVGILAARIRPHQQGEAVFDPNRIRERSPVWVKQLDEKHQELHWEELSRQIGHMLQTWTGFDSKALSGIDCPTFVAQGDRDELIPTELSEELARHIKGSQLMILPSAGHTELLYRRDLLEGLERFIRTLI